MDARESFLKRLEERLSRMSSWLAARRHGGLQPGGAPDLHGRLEALRSEIGRLPGALAEAAQTDLERVRASVEGMEQDYGAPLPHAGLQPAEREALRRHLRTVARTLRDLSNVDSPGFVQAEEDYDRSWVELKRAFESDDDRPPAA